jgi:hypothetical protein
MADPRVFASFPADPTGHVTATAFIGSHLAGASVLLQAAELSPCRISNLLSHTFR